MCKEVQSFGDLIKEYDDIKKEISSLKDSITLLDSYTTTVRYAPGKRVLWEKIEELEKHLKIMEQKRVKIYSGLTNP